MHLPYILLAAVFLAVANAAAIVPGDLIADESELRPQPEEISQGSDQELVRSKRGLLLAKAAFLKGGILGAKAAIGAGILGAGLYKAKSYGGHGGWGGGGYGGYSGGYGGYGGYGGHGGYGGYGGYGGHGGYVKTYHHYPSYYSSGWSSGPSYHGDYYSSW